MQNRSTSNSSRRSGAGREERSRAAGDRGSRNQGTRAESTRAGSSRPNSRGSRYDAPNGKSRRSSSSRYERESARSERRSSGARTDRRGADYRTSRDSGFDTYSARERSSGYRSDRRTREDGRVHRDGYDRAEERRSYSRSAARGEADRASHYNNMDGWDKFSHLQDGSRAGRQRGRSQNLNSSWAADRAANSSWQLATFMPVLAVLAVVLIAAFLVGAISSCSAPASDSSQDDTQVQPLSISFSPSIQGIDSVSDPGTTVTGISLADSSACYVPQLSNEGQTEVQNAVSAITDNGNAVGFALVDLDTGSGYAYNLDQRVYGASSFKGHILIYGCQQALETGQTSITKVNSNAQEAIINSDNNSYYRMRRQFENTASESLSSWLSSMNVSSSLANDTSFPHYSARESLKLWMNAYLYLNSSDSNQEITSWAKEMFSSTVVSMIRNGVDPNSNPVSEERMHSVSLELQGAVLGKLKTVEVGTAASEIENSSAITVYDKAGWINGSSDDAVCDAGYIEEDGKTYLITIMSNLADSDSSRTKVSNLAAALWNQRASLVPEQGFTKA